MTFASLTYEPCRTGLLDRWWAGVCVIPVCVDHASPAFWDKAHKPHDSVARSIVYVLHMPVKNSKCVNVLLNSAATLLFLCQLRTYPIQSPVSHVTPIFDKQLLKITGISLIAWCCTCVINFAVIVLYSLNLIESDVGANDSPCRVQSLHDALAAQVLRLGTGSKAVFTPGNMLPTTCCLQHVACCRQQKPATKLLPVCCPSVAVYKGIQQATCCRQHVAWCKRGLTVAKSADSRTPEVQYIGIKYRGSMAAGKGSMTSWPWPLTFQG